MRGCVVGEKELDSTVECCIFFVDSDDYVDVTFAEKLYSKAKKENADIAVCGFDRIDLDTGKRFSREMCKSEDKVIDII